MAAVVFMCVCSTRILAQNSHTHTGEQTTQLTPDQKNEQNALLRIVRDSTERFQNVRQAQAEGYVLQFGCASGDSAGAMGPHYVNGTLVNSGVIDATRL
jgi:hypothetical protein